jgi:uncharacterized protein (DUF1501 family)
MIMDRSALHLPRRHLLLGAAGAAGLTLLPHAAFAQAATDRRLLFIIQRGAADGLAMLAPVGDPAYAGLRRDLAETGGTAIGGFFALHPALAAVARMHAAGQARFFPAVASVYRDRSHFDGQNVLEGGGSRPYGRQDGWLGRLSSMLPAPDRSAIALAEAVPLALRGAAGVTSYAPSRLPAASDDLLNRVSALYASDPQLHPLWENALRTRMIAGDVGGNGGRNGAELGQLAASLMTAADGARIAMIETGGWDTHSGQRGRLAGQLRGLDALIDAVRTGLGPAWERTLIIVATEFGRTAAVNGTGGTDHGTASLAMALGGGLSRGPVIGGDWPGLAQARLYEGRDLAPAQSLETVIAGLVAEHYALDPARVQRTLYPELA